MTFFLNQFLPRERQIGPTLAVGWVVVALMLAGCRPGPPRRPLQDTDPIFLIPAIRATADAEAYEAIGRLIELLDSEDSAVRIYAIGALRDLTGQELGFRSWAPQAERQAAIERWRSWAVASGHLPAPQ